MMATCPACRDGESVRNELMDRVRRVQRTADEVFGDILRAPPSDLARLEPEVRRLEQIDTETEGDK